MSRRTLATPLALGCLLVAQAACTEGGLGSQGSAIVDGQPSGPEDDAVVLLRRRVVGGFFSCTGSLIAANLVLTARHCVSDIDPQIVCDSDGNPLYGAGVRADHMASEIGVMIGNTYSERTDAQGAQLFVPPLDTVCNADIALILLDKALDKNPLAQLRLNAPPVEGAQIAAVGWGVTPTGPATTRNRRDNIDIRGIGPFDQPGVGGIGPNELLVGESICTGDSGGPALDETTGAVVGVVSRGGNGRGLDPNQYPCGNFIDSGTYVTDNLYTRVDGFPDLFAQAFAAAGTEPWLEGGPDPRKAKLGEACAANADCRSNLCLGLPEAGYCSQACDSDPTICPANLACEDTSAGTKFCVRPKKKGCSMEPGHEDAPRGLAVGLVLLGLGLSARRARRARRAAR